MGRLSEGHAKQRSRQDHTDYRDDVEKRRDLRFADGVHGKRRRRERAKSPRQVGDVQSGGAAVAIAFGHPQIGARSDEAVAKAVKAAGTQGQGKSGSVEESETNAEKSEAEDDRGLEALARDQSAGTENAYERRGKLNQGKKAAATVVEMPLGHEEGQNRRDEGDDDAVDDETAAEQGKNNILRGVLPDPDRLRFGGHHGILPEPELRRKWVTVRVAGEGEIPRCARE